MDDEKRIIEAKRIAIRDAAHETGEVARKLGVAGMRLERIRIDLMQAGTLDESTFFDSIDHDIARTAAAWAAFVPSIDTTPPLPESVQSSTRPVGLALMREIYFAYMKPHGDYSPSGVINNEQHRELMKRTRSLLENCGGYNEL